MPPTERATITELGLRDGLQNEARFVETAQKAAFTNVNRSVEESLARACGSLTPPASRWATPSAPATRCR